uniref:Uncharacterized protein n=1 Tax=Ditylenchus dipsaci TaxID=166011 RepID=A0A915EUP1_9BILA
MWSKYVPPVVGSGPQTCECIECVPLVSLAAPPPPSSPASLIMTHNWATSELVIRSSCKSYSCFWPLADYVPCCGNRPIQAIRFALDIARGMSFLHSWTRPSSASTSTPNMWLWMRT